MHLRAAVPADLAALVSLERASYPVDEAASEDMFRYRLECAPEFFRLAHEGGQLIGFVCGTRVDSMVLTQESMHLHAPAGPLLCIHSVVVDEARRRAGVGSAILSAYLEFVRTTGVQSVSLIAKQYLVDFYQACGFELRGPSPVVHGRDAWFELQRANRK